MTNIKKIYTCIYIIIIEREKEPEREWWLEKLKISIMVTVE